MTSPDGAVVGFAEAGPSALGQGIEQAWANVLDAIDRAFRAAGVFVPRRESCALGLGVAGAIVRTRYEGFLRAAPPFARLPEIIPDLLHVHPGALALRAIPCLFCVTDSTAAAGMPDGEYPLGRHRVTKCLGGVRLADGTLAGSTLTMDEALRNLVSLGLSVGEASMRVSTHAADYLGLVDRGRLVEGAWADIVVLDSDLQLQRVVAEGEAIDLADA